MAKSNLEELLLLLIRAEGLPEPEREYRFHDTRRWRLDFAYPDKKIGIECEGGVWSRGRHTRGQGFIDDCEKYNSAAELGWLILRFPGQMIYNGMAVETIKRVLESEE